MNKKEFLRNLIRETIEEASYEDFVKGPSGDKAGRTPDNEHDLKDMIANMLPGQSILFHSQQGVRGPMINIVKLSDTSYEIEDEKKKKQRIDRYNQIDVLAKFISQRSNILSRVWVRNRASTTDVHPNNGGQVTKNEFKEFIKSSVNEILLEENSPTVEANVIFKRFSYWDLLKIWKKHNNIKKATMEATVMAIAGQKGEPEKPWPFIVSIFKQIFSNSYRIVARELFQLFKKEFEEIKELNPKESVSKFNVKEVAPPGWEGTVKAMKKHSVGGAKRWNPKKKKEEGVEESDVEEAKKKITNPYALAWWMKNQGYKSHK